MELEQAVLEAIKLKLVDTFKKVQIKTSVEGREIVIRISIPNEIMQVQELKYSPQHMIPTGEATITGLTNLDEEAQKAANELLGL